MTVENGVLTTTQLVARARDALEVGELMARYTRTVDSLDFDALADVFEPVATVRYAWRPVGASDHESIDLAGLAAICDWLRSRLTGRPDLRRFISTLEVHAWSPTAVVAGVMMHERSMRITGEYQVHAVLTPDGWRIRRLDLLETIHH